MNCSRPVYTNGYTMAATSVHLPTPLVRAVGVSDGDAARPQLGGRGRLTGSRCRCMACCELFNSASMFDGHRVGNLERRGANRHCLTRGEMLGRGWLVNGSGFRISRRRPDATAGSGDRCNADSHADGPTAVSAVTPIVGGARCL